jgi:hypothetical protein
MGSSATRPNSNSEDQGTSLSLTPPSKPVRHGWPYQQLCCRRHSFGVHWWTQAPSPSKKVLSTRWRYHRGDMLNTLQWKLLTSGSRKNITAFFSKTESAMNIAVGSVWNGVHEESTVISVWNWICKDYLENISVKRCDQKCVRNLLKTNLVLICLKIQSTRIPQRKNITAKVSVC